MRQPFQILCFPFIKVGDDYTFAIFKRSDFDVWQGIAGGGEDDETPPDTVKRECLEEAGISKDSKYIELNTVSKIPSKNISAFKDREDLEFIPEYAFGVELFNKNLNISNEHLEYKWCGFEEAMKDLEWESNKNTLQELYQNLNTI